MTPRDASTTVLDRRRILAFGGAFVGMVATGIGVKPANAFAPLLLRALTLGVGRAGATTLAGRSAVAGRALLRPRSAPINYGSYSARAIFNGGRWIYNHQNSSGYAGAYTDDSEYRWEHSRYPDYFASVPAELYIENRTYRNLLMPSTDVYLSLSNGHVWQAYTIDSICVPPGVERYDLALNGVPTGWDYYGVASTEDDEVFSEVVDG